MNSALAVDSSHESSRRRYADLARSAGGVGGAGAVGHSAVSGGATGAGAADGGGRPAECADRRRGGGTAVTVRAWRTRFAEEGLARFAEVREGRGRKPSIPAETVNEIVRVTLHETPPGATHWSTRTMAARVGVSRDTVHRVWRARGLQPHRVETFKLSNDPRFEEKLVDVVGLYLNPPDKGRGALPG